MLDQFVGGQDALALLPALRRSYAGDMVQVIYRRSGLARLAGMAGDGFDVVAAAHHAEALLLTAATKMQQLGVPWGTPCGK